MILTEVYANCTKKTSVYFRKIVEYSGLKLYFRKYIIKTVRTTKTIWRVQYEKIQSQIQSAKPTFWKKHI